MPGLGGPADAGGPLEPGSVLLMVDEVLCSVLSVSVAVNARVINVEVFTRGRTESGNMKRLPKFKLANACSLLCLQSANTRQQNYAKPVRYF